ncbi:MAG: amine oxidase [Gemmatimonadetes bacterium]|nr:amine oxidase [Gemmatimonadota bacterium]
MKRIVILGAGPLGLGAAHRLQQLGYRDFTVYDKNDYVGGLAASFTDDEGFTWDIGGHVIFSHYEFFDAFMAEMVPETVSHGRESWVWVQDRFIAYPFQNNFHFLEKDVVLECVLGLHEAQLKFPSYTNFHEWILHCFGEGIATYFMIPYNFKVWATPAELMDSGWIAERVSVVDMKMVLANIVGAKKDASWGPNSTFDFPLRGGTGGLFSPMRGRLGRHLKLERNLISIDPEAKRLRFDTGEEDSYDMLVNGAPLDLFVPMIEGVPNAVREAAREMVFAGGWIVGVGFRQPCPSDKNWMYFPESNCPFYRVTYLSNYSPLIAPDKDHYSLLCEISESKYKPVTHDEALEQTLQGLINTRLISESDRDAIVSTHVIRRDHTYPVPFLGRDDRLRVVQAWLESKDILSRGRFGGWKYEVGNMDHSVQMGKEAVDRILEAKKESVYEW